jgi:hypothetical protein
MPQARRKQRSKQNYQTRALPIPQVEVAQEETKPVRGVKLKTVSAFTMLFALACLAAFMAGRPPVSAAGRPAQGTALLHKQANSQRLRHDDARRLFGRALGKREPGAKKIEKSAGTRASVRFLFANTQQKNQQAKNI